MDDFFGWDFTDNLVYFREERRPRKQVQLLLFWEAIRCPFSDIKQQHGEVLKIIGFWIDANLGSISLSPRSIDDLIDKINSFLSHRQHALRDWQRLAGHINWLFNVLPWGRPALTEFYRKISGKRHQYAMIPLNRTVIEDLSWLRAIIPESTGIRFVDAELWNDCDADFVVWTDASLSALAFTYAGNGFVYPLSEPSNARFKTDIFFLELIAILSAVFHIASFDKPPRRVLLWTDSLDSVAVLNSLRAKQDIHNAPLLAIANIILRSGINLRLRHLTSKENIRADMLSCLLLSDFSRKFPSDRVRIFSPPRDLLPARWQDCF